VKLWPWLIEPATRSYLFGQTRCPILLDLFHVVLRQRQLERGYDSGTLGHFVRILHQWGGQGVPSTKRHPWGSRRPEGEELASTAGRGFRLPRRSSPQRGSCLHRCRSRPSSGRAIRADILSLQHAVRLAEEMRGYVLSTACVTHVAVGARIGRGATSASKGHDPRRSRATCAMCASLNVFGRQTTSSNMTAKPIPVFG
jgi:hypothetical protein